MSVDLCREGAFVGASMALIVVGALLLHYGVRPWCHGLRAGAASRAATLDAGKAFLVVVVAACVTAAVGAVDGALEDDAKVAFWYHRSAGPGLGLTVAELAFTVSLCRLLMLVFVGSAAAVIGCRAVAAHLRARPATGLSPWILAAGADGSVRRRWGRMAAEALAWPGCYTPFDRRHNPATGALDLRYDRLQPAGAVDDSDDPDAAASDRLVAEEPTAPRLGWWGIQTLAACAFSAGAVSAVACLMGVLRLVLQTAYVVTAIAAALREAVPPLQCTPNGSSGARWGVLVSVVVVQTAAVMAAMTWFLGTRHTSALHPMLEEARRDDAARAVRVAPADEGTDGAREGAPTMMQHV